MAEEGQQSRRTVFRIFHGGKAADGGGLPANFPSEEVCAALLRSPALARFGALDKPAVLQRLASERFGRLRLLIVRLAVRDLAAAGRPEDAYSLFALPQSQADATHLIQWLRAAARLGGREISAEAARQVQEVAQAQGIEDERLTALLIRLRTTGQVGDPDEDFLLRWGEPRPATLGEGLQGLERHADKAQIDPALLNWVYEQRADRSMDFKTFRARAVFGALAAQYSMSYMRGYAIDLTPAQRRELADICADLDGAPFGAHVQAGRPVVVALSHSGMWHMLSGRLRTLPLPVVQIGANNRRGEEEGAFLSTRGNFQTEFLKLIKRIRKAPAIISIVADGPYGGDLLEMEFMGRRLSVAQGAAALAYHTGAATFFAGTRWDGGKVTFYATPGPVAERGMDRAAWDRAWYGFYFDCLRDIVRGPPEDMRLYSGVWRALADSLGEAKTRRRA